MKLQQPGTFSLYRRILVYSVLILPLFLFSGCNALKRGDFLQKTDNTLYFTEIGFHLADNPELSRDAVTAITGTSPDIVIMVPYFRGDLPAQPLDLTFATGTPLVIDFKLVAKDAFVEYEDSTFTWQAAVSGVTEIPFHDNGVFDIGTQRTKPVQFRVGKQDGVNGQVDYAYFNVYAEKDIRPKILTPVLFGPAIPSVTIEVAFVDENGVEVPVIGASDPLVGTEISYDGWRINWIAGPTPNAGPPEHYLLDVQPLYPGEHWMKIQDLVFADPAGFYAGGGDLSFYYDPPAVHLSHNGNDGNTGFAPDDAVQTWGAALTIINGGGIFDLYIEASSTPYDISGWPYIDNLFTTYFGVYGGFTPGFVDRYDGDWDSRPQTILYRPHGSGTGELTPDYVLELDNVPLDFVFDNLQIEGAANRTDTSALLLSNGAKPILNDLTLIASQGAGSSAGLTVLNGSNPIIRRSRIIGKNGGSGKSMGLRIDNAIVDLEQTFILGGDITDVSHGIDASSNSTLNIWNSAVLSGFLDPSSNNRTETTSRGISALDTDINAINAWIHSATAGTETTAVSINNSNGSNRILEIFNSTLIADRSGTPSGLNALHSGGGNNQLAVFNSVILVDRADIDDARGIVLDGFAGGDLARLSNNAIRVGTVAVPDFSVGIDAIASSNLEIHNNLIWSHQSADLLGIRSNIDISGNPIRHNNFWDNDGPVQLNLDPVGVPLPADWDIPDWHALGGLVHGNISWSVAVDTSFSYTTDSLDVGRLTGSRPDDVIYGGEYLTWLPIDREGQTRTETSFVGYSMGPYEYGSDNYLPPYIHVSPSGDDGHPLGTTARPFASLARAYNLARVAITPGPRRTDVIEIRVAQGDYDLDAPAMPVISNGSNIRISGGYSPSFGGPNPSAYVTRFYRSAGSTLLTFDSGATDAILEGFTLDNGAAPGNPINIYVDNGAWPQIQDNIIIGGPGADSRGIYATGGSAPRIIDNHILGGNTAGGQSYGIFLLNAGFTEIDSNDIQGGTGNLTRGISMQNTPAIVISNTIRAGDATNDAVGLYLSTNPGFTEIRHNTVMGGTATAVGGNTRGMYFQNAGGGTIIVEANSVFGGESLDTSTGIELDSSDETALINNVVHAGATVTNTIRGINVTNGGNRVWLFNNTVYGGRTTGNISEAIRISGNATPHVVNNIIITGESIPGAMGFREVDAVKPTRFLNNLILGSDDPLPGDIAYQTTGGPLNNFAAIDLYLTGGIPDPNYAGHQVSLTENPAVYFNRFTAVGGEAEFLGDSWRLSGGGSRNASTGGVNLSGDPDHPFSTDRNNSNRSTPWSIGAYEY